MNSTLCQSFLGKLDSKTPVLICMHAIGDPARLVLVHHSEEGVISASCEKDHEMGVEDWRRAHAGHIAERHSQVGTLADVPPNHVAMFFSDHDNWAVETVLDDEDCE